MKPETFSMRNDKYLCERLARKHSYEDKFVDFASTIYAHADYPKKLWTRDFSTKDAETTYNESIKWTDALVYSFSQELEMIMQSGIDAGSNFNWAVSGSSDLPPLIKFLFQKTVSLEFCCVLEQRLGMIESWSKIHSDDVFYDQFASRVEHFRPFLMRRCFPDGDITVISNCMETVVKKFK